MKTATFFAAYAAILGFAVAEVPLEHSHQNIIDSVNTLLKANNPNNIQDAIFGLLGNKAAAAGAGKITNLDCLHQATADQAFSNAKAAKDVQGQSDALVYAALERNTGSVGLKSVLCNDTAVNPEIQAIQQHQDPASDGAAATNKAIALEVAKQIASIGGNPNDAIQSGTFAPGKIGDPTAKGNTCDVADDAKGCINSQNLLVPDVSAAEIKAAVAGVKAARSVKATRAANVNAFTGTVGSAAVPIESTAGAERAFSVNGATFLNKGAAVQRACDVQNNACFNAANSGKLAGGTSQCSQQHDACLAANGSKKLRKSRKVTKLRRAALDLGSCNNPAIAFGAGFDGRKEDSFEPADKTEFTHGSALNIKVISGFICDRLSSNCKASADAVSKCQAGATAANGLKGQAAADAFNSALGVSA